MRILYMAKLFLSCFFVFGCASINTVSGYIPLEKNIEELVVGKTRAEEVRRILGDPLATESEPELTWVYIHQKIQTTAFMKPKVVDREVLSLSFNRDSILTEVRRYDETQSNKINYNKAFVATQGREITFWQQIFGNIGNFSSEQLFD